MCSLARLALLSALLLCTPSCRHLPWSAQSRDERCLVSLLPSQQIAETFRLRQRFLIRLGDESHRVDTVAERRGESFVVVGFTPFGTRGFVLTQTGTDISLDDRIGRRMGLRPLLLLDAIHRSYLMAPEGGLPPDGVTVWLREGESITDAWANGVLRSRVFRAADGERAGSVSIFFSDERKSTIRSDWCGYEAGVLKLSPAPVAAPRSAT